MLTQVNLWAKGAAQLAKDNVRKKRVGGRRRNARKLRLNRAISARMGVISASTIELTVPEDDGDEMVDHPWTVLAKKTSRFIN